MKIGILSDFTNIYLQKALKREFKATDASCEIFDGAYNSIDQEVLDATSWFFQKPLDVLILFPSTEILWRIYSALGDVEKEKFAEQQFKRISLWWDSVEKLKDTQIIQSNFIEKDDGVWGRVPYLFPQSFYFQIRLLNQMIEEGARKRPNILINDLAGLSQRNGQFSNFDSRLFYTVETGFNKEFNLAVAKNIYELLQIKSGKLFKCLILDLDNVMWGGVVGDAGLEGIEIGETSIGRAYQDFQRWVKLLKERGIILAVCSKNNQELAEQPFKELASMIVKYDDVSVFVANWKDKAQNIHYIQQCLNIDFSSMIFLDDSPFEREQVREEIPTICIPELPENVEERLPFLMQSGLFSTLSYDSADKDRARHFHAEKKRRKSQKASSSLDEYLISLSMNACFGEADEKQYKRIAQLTQRTNQFNLQTIRMNVEDIAVYLKQPDRFLFQVYLADKFGDYGGVSSIFTYRDGDTYKIYNWLMSCRVFSRGLEFFIIERIVRHAQNLKCKTVLAEYKVTAKNHILKDILPNTGLSEISESLYQIELKHFKPSNHYITENKK